ncbi:MAG: DUF2141 domain-containing protein [Ignavibacteriaceae bacterium]|nr:DUF2141 domain-containing protein [Ignavibacteriaceae bacterium]
MFSFIRLSLITISIIISLKPELIFAQVSENILNTGKLTVIITGFDNNIGNCRFALDNSKFIYERDDSVWIGKVLPIVNKQVVVVIDSLEFGEYAIRIFHDENENEKIDTNIFGIPTEDYGYSNDASSWFGPPSWEKAKFLFNQSEMTIEIKVDSFL